MSRWFGWIAVLSVLAVLVVLSGGCRDVKDKVVIIPDETPPTTSASPVGGHYAAAVTVTLSATDTRDPAPQMHYTTDGVTTPTTASTLYTAGILISTDTLLQWIAVDDQDNVSAVHSEGYVIDTVDPTLSASLASGHYDATQLVTLTASDDKSTAGEISVYYTTDGVTTPTSASTAYTGAVSILVDTTLMAIAYDLAGNSSSVLTRDYIIDTTLPLCSITLPATGSDVVDLVAVEGTASDTSPGVLDTVEIRITEVSGGATVVDWTAVTGTDNWSYDWDTTSGVNDGDHTIEARSCDLAGNYSTVDSVTVTVRNLEAPDISITAPAEGARVGGITVSVAGAATPVAPAILTAVDVRIDGGSWTAADNDSGDWTAWSYDWDSTSVSDGSHTIYVRATDSNTLARIDFVDVTVDNTDPTVAITSPADGGYVCATVNIAGTANDADGGSIALVQVRIEDGVGAPVVDWTTASGTTSWTYDWDSTGLNGDYTIKAQSTDSVGNTSAVESITIHVDNTAPTMPEAYPGNGWTDVKTGTNINLLFSETMDTTSVENNFLLTKQGEATPLVGSLYWRTRSTDGAFVIIFVPDDFLEDETTYEVDISPLPTDLAGNSLAGFSAYTFDTGDCTQPEVTSTVPAANSVVQADTVSSITVNFNEDMHAASGWLCMCDRLTDFDMFEGDINHPALSWSDSDTLILDFDKALDESREVEESGDGDDQVDYWEFNGAEKGGNTDADGKLYAKIWDDAGQYTVSLYTSGTPLSGLVASGWIGTTEGWVDLGEENSSGLFGGVEMEYSTDDDTIVLDLPFIELQPGRSYELEVYAQDDHWVSLAPVELGPGELIHDMVLFSTEAAGDSTGPEVVGTLPADSATGVSARRLIYIFFSELLDMSSFATGDLAITDDSGAVTYKWGLHGNRLMLYPDKVLDGSVTVTLAANSVGDLAATPNTGPSSEYSFSFDVTDDTTAPVISQVFPASGAVDINENEFQGGAIFSEIVSVTVDATSLGKIVVKDPSGAPIKGLRFTRCGPDEVLLPTGQSVTFLAPFGRGAEFPGLLYWDEAADFTVELSTGITDLSGNALAGTYQWVVTSRPSAGDNAAPYAMEWAFDENIWMNVWNNGNVTLEFFIQAGDEDNATAGQHSEKVGDGNGIQTNWTGTLANTPVWEGSLVFSAGCLVAWDDWSGDIAGDATGTIDYTTGGYDITWSTAPADGDEIQASYGVGGLDVQVKLGGTAKWRLTSGGGTEYSYYTPETDMSMPGNYTDSMSAHFTLGAVNTFTFTIEDGDGHTLTFDKQVYIPDPGDFIVLVSPDVNEGVLDTTPTFTWNAATIPFDGMFAFLYVGGNIERDEDIGEFMLGSQTQFTLPDPLALNTGKHLWVVGSELVHPGGDTVTAFGLSWMLERHFWVTDASLGSISGTVSIDAGVSERDMVMVAVWDESSFSGEPIAWTVAKYNNGTDDYTYTIHCLPNDTYYVRGVMDTPPYDMGEGSDNPAGQYGAPDAVVVDNANKHRTGIDFTVSAP